MYVKIVSSYNILLNLNDYYVTRFQKIESQNKYMYKMDAKQNKLTCVG